MEDDGRALTTGFVQPAMVGLAVGGAWAILLLCVAVGNWRPSEVLRYTLPVPLGFAITAVVVHHVRRLPELVGAATAFLVMFVAALVAAESLLALAILVITYSVSAVICGPMIGLLLRRSWVPSRTLPPLATTGGQPRGKIESRSGRRIRSILAAVLLLAAASLAFSLAWGYRTARRQERELSAEIETVNRAAALVGNHGASYSGDRIELCFRGREVDDTKLRHLTGLRLIVALDLSETQITDAGLPAISDLTRLDYLQLGNTAITDRGLECLSRLENLQALDLVGTQVTQAGAKHLERLPKLRVVYAKATGLTSLRGIHLDTTHESKPWGGDVEFLRGLDRYRASGSHKEWDFTDPKGFGRGN